MLFGKSQLWFCNYRNRQTECAHIKKSSVWSFNRDTRVDKDFRALLKPGPTTGAEHSRALRRFDLRIHLLSSRHFTAALFKEATTWHTVWSGESRWTLRCISLGTREKPLSLPRRGATMSPETRTSIR